MSARPARQRLAGLDGLRGLAAVYVVVNHVFLRAFPGYPVDHAPFWAGWFIYGRFAVVVFIVLSGFSLALSPARHGWRLDELSGFAQRRAWRILPAYWAALAFSLVVAWLLVAQPGNGIPDAKSVIVNGLLVQNIVAAHSPNAAFWSMAVEAQLYLAFPLLLLMVRRRGAVVMVATVTLIVATVGIVGPHVSHLNVFVIQSRPIWPRCSRSASSPRASSAQARLGGRGRGVGSRSPPPRRCSPRSGGRVRCGRSITCTGSISRSAQPSPACWPLWPPAVRRRYCACSTRGRCAASASCSYSLYLTHAPIVAVVCELIVAGRVHRGVPFFLVSLALVVPLAIVFARVFASVFEIPFRQRQRTSRVVRRRHPRAAGGAGMSRTVWSVGPPRGLRR